MTKMLYTKPELKTIDPGYVTLRQDAAEIGEVGEEVRIDTPLVAFYATFLGTVGANGWSLTDACRLMCEMAEEREACSEG